MSRTKCKNGHVIAEAGRDRWGHCVACAREADKKRAAARNSKRRQMAAAHRAQARNAPLQRRLTEEEEDALVGALLDATNDLAYALFDVRPPSIAPEHDRLKETQTYDPEDEDGYWLWMQSQYNLARAYVTRSDKRPTELAPLLDAFDAVDKASTVWIAGLDGYPAPAPAHG